MYVANTLGAVADIKVLMLFYLFIYFAIFY
jgi:hypothetical protein